MADISEKLNEIAEKFSEPNFQKAVHKGWYENTLTGRAAHSQDLTGAPKAAIAAPTPVPAGYPNEEYARLSREDKQKFLLTLSQNELSTNARAGRAILGGIAGLVIAGAAWVSGNATYEYNKYSPGVHQAQKTESATKIAAPWIAAASAFLLGYGILKKK